jgi:hypothetical protein
VKYSREPVGLAPSSEINRLNSGLWAQAVTYSTDGDSHDNYYEKPSMGDFKDVGSSQCLPRCRLVKRLDKQSVRIGERENKTDERAFLPVNAEAQYI